jgi:hypothetical protein
MHFCEDVLQNSEKINKPFYSGSCKIGLDNFMIQINHNRPNN